MSGMPVLVTPKPEVPQSPTLSSLLAESREKIAEDVIRFRTCCADPRASK